MPSITGWLAGSPRNAFDMKLLRRDIYAITLHSASKITKEIQVYLIKGRDEHLLIDIGFHSASAADELCTALKQLNVELKDVRLFLTHLHVDHCGNAQHFAPCLKEILASEWDGCMITHKLNKTTAYYIRKNRLLAGIPRSVCVKLKSESEIFEGGDGVFAFTPIHAHERLRVGDYTFEVIDLAGHSPQQIGLYEINEHFMFAADSVLNQIYPTINFWMEEFSSMQDNFDTLKRICDFDCEIVYPAHYGPISDIKERCMQTLDHHMKKGKYLLDVVKQGSGTAYDFAMRMQWGRQLSRFDRLSCPQQWFACMELLAHLERFYHLGILSRELIDGHWYYHIKE
ncbi:MBL fold metallo-hydrolase [Dielma fastidiosa]|uniref:MBL fold metallo-hydrolase n=1 Tax=Dielma fastidiosa TaxID=1034346 RepID=UPI0035643D83